MRAVPVAATMGVVKLTVSGLELKVDDRDARPPLLCVRRRVGSALEHGTPPSARTRAQPSPRELQN